MQDEPRLMQGRLSVPHILDFVRSLHVSPASSSRPDLAAAEPASAGAQKRAQLRKGYLGVARTLLRAQAAEEHGGDGEEASSPWLDSVQVWSIFVDSGWSHFLTMFVHNQRLCKKRIIFKGFARNHQQLCPMRMFFHTSLSFSTH